MDDISIIRHISYFIFIVYMFQNLLSLFVFISTLCLDFECKDITKSGSTKLSIHFNTFLTQSFMFKDSKILAWISNLHL